MIDDKKIEEAAFGYVDDEGEGFEAFIDGAKWAINEFLKDLWHPVSEIPELGRMFVMECHYYDGKIELYSRIRCETFHNPLSFTSAQRWFYVDDLLPKQKGE